MRKVIKKIEESVGCRSVGYRLKSNYCIEKVEVLETKKVQLEKWRKVWIIWIYWN